MKKSKITKGERLLYFAGIFCLVATVVVKIFFGASVGNYQMSNEKIRYQISVEQKDVESLTMQVNELTSFDNVQSVVKDLGLAYNNDNIIILGD
jgi:cell division protein FtsL